MNNYFLFLIIEMEEEEWYIPLEAVDFEPDDQDIFFRIGEKRQRLIFDEPQEFEEQEIDQIKEFKSHNFRKKFF